MEPSSYQPDPREWWCRLILRCLAASFAIVGALFFVAPDGTIRAMTGIGAALGDFTPAPASALRFWLSLGTGYMVLVTALAYIAQRDLQRHRVLVALLALGKATSALTCLAFYLFSLDTFIYLANFLVDGSIAVTATVIWMMVPSLRIAPTADVGAVDSVDTVRRRHDLATERRIASILEAMVPDGGPFADGARGVVSARALESFAAGAGPSAVRALRFLLQLVEVSPYFLPPLRMRRFSQLPVADRVALLEAWERSRLVPRRQAMQMLKVLVMTHFYSRPEIATQLGYPPPLERVPRSQEDVA
jgi:hypothetical protein